MRPRSEALRMLGTKSRSIKRHKKRHAKVSSLPEEVGSVTVLTPIGNDQVLVRTFPQKDIQTPYCWAGALSPNRAPVSFYTNAPDGNRPRVCALKETGARLRNRA